MKKIFKKSALILMCVAVIFGITPKQATLNTPVEARTIDDVNDEIKSYESLLSQVQAELKQIQNQISAIEGNISSLEDLSAQQAALFAQYQTEIDALEIEIMLNEEIRASYDMKRAQVMAEIAIKQEDYDYRVSMYKKLMQFIYENGNTSSFELLFSSGNISEFLTRRDHFNDIMNAANELMAEINISIKELEEQYSKLEDAQQKYEEHGASLADAQDALEQKRDELRDFTEQLGVDMEELSASIGGYSEQYAQKAAKIKEIKQKISELKSERQELEELEAQKNAAFHWPVQGSGRVSSPYGYRSDPFTGAKSFHNGIDIAIGRGTPVLATADGIITRADWFSGYGNCVIIYHGAGISSLYGHLDNGNSSRPTFEVKVGDKVKKGQVIAYVGTTGRSTGYHLHFSIMDNATADNAFSRSYVDPNIYLYR